MSLVKLQIKNGPTKQELADGLFKRAFGLPSPQVPFHVEGRGQEASTLQVVITSVAIDEGSRESWCIIGWIKGRNGKGREYLSAYYETIRRTGGLTLNICARPPIDNEE